MNVLTWVKSLFTPRPPKPTPPPVPIDQEPGPLGELARLGEALAGDAPPEVP